jgi:alanine racemase
MRSRVLCAGFALFTALFLTACAGDPVAPSPIARPVGLAPLSGPVNGGQLLFVQVEEKADGIGKASLSCHFGKGEPAPGNYDQKSDHYVCHVPPHPRPEAVTITVRVNGLMFEMKERYAYTTRAKRGPPVLRIDTEELRNRVRNVRAALSREVKLSAVLKNGEPVGWLADVMSSAVPLDYFSVPTLQDGIDLREAGVENPIMILYLTDAVDAPLMLHYDLEPAAISLSWVLDAHRRLARTGSRLRVHLWVDTGMTREGVMPNEALPLARAIADSPYLHLQGVATHFCCLEEDDRTALEENDLENQTTLQKHRFDQVIESLHAEGLGLDAIVHAGSSDAIRYQLDQIYYDMLRVGTMLFENPRSTRRNYTWTTRILQTKTLPEGWCVDYGCYDWLTRETRVGILAHIPDDEAAYFIGGQQVEVLLHHETVIVLDITNLQNVAEGTEVSIVLSGDDSPLDTYSNSPVTLQDRARSTIPAAD